MATEKKPELPQRHNGVTRCDVYEFDFQRSSGYALLGMYMSFRFAVQGCRKTFPICRNDGGLRELNPAMNR